MKFAEAICVKEGYPMSARGGKYFACSMPESVLSRTYRYPELPQKDLSRRQSKRGVDNENAETVLK